MIDETLRAIRCGLAWTPAAVYVRNTPRDCAPPSELPGQDS